MWSLIHILESEFRSCFTLCLFIIRLVLFVLMNGHLLGKSCPLGWPYVPIVNCLYSNALFISHFGFKSGIWLLIASVPVHCFSITPLRFTSLMCRISYPHGHQISRHKTE